MSSAAMFADEANPHATTSPLDVPSWDDALRTRTDWLASRTCVGCGEPSVALLAFAGPLCAECANAAYAAGVARLRETAATQATWRGAADVGRA